MDRRKQKGKEEDKREKSNYSLLFSLSFISVYIAVCVSSRIVIPGGGKLRFTRSIIFSTLFVENLVSFLFGGGSIIVFVFVIR